MSAGMDGERRRMEAILREQLLDVSRYLTPPTPEQLREWSRATSVKGMEGR